MIDSGMGARNPQETLALTLPDVAILPRKAANADGRFTACGLYHFGEPSTSTLRQSNNPTPPPIKQMTVTRSSPLFSPLPSTA